MRVLFIGGTGTISSAITRQLAQREDCELYLLNRGTYAQEVPAGVKTIVADINDEADVAKKLEGMTFDSVCDFIGFVPEQLERAVPDFVTHVPFSQGCRKAVQHILAHPELQQEDPEFDAWTDNVIAALEEAGQRLRSL